MRIRSSSAHGLIAAALLPLLGTTMAHSWPEETRRIAPNGTMIGEPGYARMHHQRGTVAENDIVWFIPPNGNREKVILATDKIVREEQGPLTAASYERFPMLKVAPGDFVAIQYTENGHVSRPEVSNPNKTVNRGTVYLYGTSMNDLSNSNLMDIHLVWTADGKGGDGKGKLLATRNYDDGQCHEAIPATGDTEGITTHRKAMLGLPLNGGLTCQSDLQIPFDVSPGQTYTVIWVWDWSTMSEPGVAVPPASYFANSSDSGQPYVTEPELYTGVVDYNIVGECDESLGDVKGPTCGGNKGNGKSVVQYAKQNSPFSAAIRAQMLKPFLVDVPQAGNGATAATAKPTDIPVFGLIGMKNPGTPLPASFFQPLNGPDTPDEPQSQPQPQPTEVPGAAPTAPSPPKLPVNKDRILTVTVTVPATTLYVTETETSTATAGLPSGTGNLALLPSQTATEGGPPVVTPFMRSRKIRREPGAWHF